MAFKSGTTEDPVEIVSGPHVIASIIIRTIAAAAMLERQDRRPLMHNLSNKHQFDRAAKPKRMSSIYMGLSRWLNINRA